MKKPEANLSDHIRMAARIEIAGRAMMSTIVDLLQHHVPKNSREMRIADKALDNIEMLKSLLDDIVCRDEPDGISHWCTHVYYGEWSHILKDGYGPDGMLVTDMLFDDIARSYAKELESRTGIDIRITDYDSHAAKYFRGTTENQTDDHASKTFALSDYPLHTYALVPDQIRDFCKDAIESGELPTDEQVNRCVWAYELGDKEQEDE